MRREISFIIVIIEVRAFRCRFHHLMLLLLLLLLLLGDAVPYCDRAG